LKEIKKGAPYEFEIAFNQIKWNTLGVNSMISLSFATLLQHHTGQSAISSRINVENLAQDVVLTQDPPPEVSINQIFGVEALVTVTGGFPLANAKVFCNVTKALDLSKVSSEIFTSLANTEYNIQRSSLLAPGSRLDESRVSAITNKKGIAKLYLRVSESPLDSSVRLVCQSGRAMTAPSPKIRITHTVKKITQNENYSETVKLEFNRGPDGFIRTEVKLKTDFVINLHKEENAAESLIRVADFVVIIIPYSEVELIRDSNDNINDIVGGFNNYTEEESVVQELIDLGITLMRGVQTVNSIRNQYANRNRATFNKPIIENNQVKISNVSLFLDKPGKYALVFGANGIFTDVQVEETKIEVINEIFVVKKYFDIYHTVILSVFYF